MARPIPSFNPDYLTSTAEMWILLIEDERDLAESLQTGLEEMGYTVDVVSDGIRGEIQALTNTYDVLIVDWMLPRQDGISLIKRIRAQGVTTPVLVLTALTDVEDRVKGLDAGADDYLTKPFSFEELFARLRALIRRSQSAGTDPYAVIQAGPLRVTPERRSAMMGNNRVELRHKEYALLELLARRAGTVVTRTVIAERVWGSAVGTSDDVINMTVSSLRKKLTEVPGIPPEESISIETIRGVGYRLSLTSSTTTT
jgi:two-component system copper resistance phosphate regulon response regulator CusR